VLPLLAPLVGLSYVLKHDPLIAYQSAIVSDDCMSDFTIVSTAP
jgi:hypothetical protein